MLRWSLVLLTLLACHGDEAPTESPSPCEGYVPTWEGWTQGFFRIWCGACHRSTSVDRNGAPKGVNFDTESGALQWRDRVRARVIDDGSMPIGGGEMRYGDRSLGQYCPNVAGALRDLSAAVLP